MRACIIVLVCHDLMQISPKSAANPTSSISRAVIASIAASARRRSEACRLESPAMSAKRSATACRQHAYFRRGPVQDSNLCAANPKCRMMCLTPPPCCPRWRSTIFWQASSRVCSPSLNWMSFSNACCPVKRFTCCCSKRPVRTNGSLHAILTKCAGSRWIKITFGMEPFRKSWATFCNAPSATMARTLTRMWSNKTVSLDSPRGVQKRDSTHKTSRPARSP